MSESIDPKSVPLLQKREVTVGDVTVDLDPDRLLFNEATLGEFQERLATWYDHFGEMFCKADYYYSCAKEHAEIVYSKIYAEKKDDGATEKQAEAQARVHEDTIKAKKSMLQAKYKRDQIQQHLKSWDKAHENAQNRGHTLRKEMDKLQSDIYFKNRELAERTEEIVSGS
jgi:hypothetical protein